LCAFAKFLAIVGLLSMCALNPALAALSPDAADAPSATTAEIGSMLDGMRKEISAVQSALQEPPADAELLKMRDTALQNAGKAGDAAKALAPALSRIQARLAELGPPPPGAKEARDIAAQRAQLDKSRTDLDAQIKLAGLLSVEAEQIATQISVMRRNRFQASLSERTPSILAPAFWNELHDDIPQDTGRLRAVAAQLGAAARTTPASIWAIAGLLAIGLGVLRVITGRFLLRLTATKVPAGRLRRSLHAATLVLLSTATPALMALALLIALRWNSRLPDDIDDFLTGALGLVGFSGYITGLGQALLLPDRPSWRLLPLPDGLARRMRGAPLTLALVLAGVWLADHLSILIDAGLATAVANNCIVALLLGLIITFWLQRGARKWRKLRAQSNAGPSTQTLWLRGVIVVQWLMLCISLLSLLMGYVAFGSFVVKQVAWTLVVLGSCYLLTVLADDACIAIGSAAQRADAAAAAEPQTPRMRDQAAVLLSGVARLVLILIALILLAAPFGQGPAELVQRANQLHDGIAIGEIAIRPAAVLQTLLVLGLTLLGVKILKRWMEGRYLPTTRLDPGMRTSAVTLFGYAGGVLAVALALSSLGIGLDRIAWVASALSVGIGFGLQAVVQNFVSGLILLAERPVKVGDWVSLGGVEGDIRRINVRATEIQMGDRSTVIVPNSEFITKTVRNVTHASPLGLVQIKLPLPLETDAEQARALLLETLRSNESMLDAPAPNVQLDGIEGNNLVFNATGFVSSPRLAYGVRSDLLFDALKRLREAGISMARQPTMLIGPSLLSGADKAPDSPLNQPGPQAMPIPPHI
jgi:small-conductance mechanosensitive channel